MRVRFDFEPLVITVFFSGIAMIVHAFAGLIENEYNIAQAFLLSGLILAVLATFVGIALANQRPPSTVQSKLIRLATTIICLPALLSVPLIICMPSVPKLHIYFEMVSCLTTTGATILPEGERLSDMIHLWRGSVAWIGGFIVLSTAIAIIMPARTAGLVGSASASSGRNGAYSVGRNRTVRAVRLFLAYSGATLLLWIGLTVLEDSPLDSLIHAMSIISTSGVSADGQLAMPGRTVGSEILITLFLILAVTGAFLATATSSSLARTTLKSSEFWLAMAVAGLACIFVLIDQASTLPDSVSGFQVAAQFIDALLGTVFTVFSFLTTTGFQSAFWIEPTGDTRENHVGIILTFLALMGGSVISTAGGTKLLRVLALVELGITEIRKMVHPSSAGPASGFSGLRKEELIACGALFMLFVLSTVFVMISLAIAGKDFEPALVIAASMVSSTGPLADTVLGSEFSFSEFSDGIIIALAGAMIVGRLELVALIAILASALRRI